MMGFEPAYTLLADAEGLPEAMVDRIYGRMPAGRLIKTTRARRFDELDRMIVREVESRMPPDRTVRVHDVAASSAITSVELFHRLSEIRSVAMKASDYYDALFRVRLCGVDFLLDADGAPLQVAIGRVAFSARRGPWRRLSAPFWPSARERLHRAERISLFHPEALRLAAINPAFKLVREDFFRPASDQFDVVRLANALWPSYTPEQTRGVVRDAAATVSEGGLFVLGRAGDYSIFVRLSGGFSEIATIGKRPDDAETVRSLGI